MTCLVSQYDSHRASTDNKCMHGMVVNPSAEFNHCDTITHTATINSQHACYGVLGESAEFNHYDGHCTGYVTASD